MDARDAALAAARELLAKTEGHPDPVTVHADAPGVRVTVRVVAVRRGRTACEGDVLDVLAGAAAPLTTSKILAELARRGALHGDQTVKVTLARLVKAGLVTASRRAPMGYRLAG